MCFLGYPEGVKGYKLWCIEPGSEKCMISRDVVFKEEEFPLKESGSKSEDSHLQHNELRVEIELANEPDHTEMLLDHSVSEQTHGSPNHRL